jgi:hypothetical protein
VRIKTIWHYAFAFFESEEDLKDFRIDVEPFYSGKVKDLSYEKASKIAQIHPNCLKYYDFAMMPLFQGKGKWSSGTENPVMALESYKTKGELKVDMPYILIWKIFDNEES